MTVRAATSLAHRYLQRKDRVGVVSFGGFLSWLLPGSGTLQLYRIVDSLLQMNIVLSFAARGVDVLPPRIAAAEGARDRADTAPRSARGGGLLDLRARGFDLVVVEVSPVPFVDGRRRSAGEALVPALAALARGAPRPVRARRRSRRRMARRRSPQRPARGGGGIQAVRKARARIALAAASACTYAGVFAYALAREHERTAAPVTAALGGLGALLLLLVLRRADADLLPWPLGLLGVALCRRDRGARLRRGRGSPLRRGRAPPLRRAGGVVDGRAVRDQGGPRRRDRARGRRRRARSAAASPSPRSSSRSPRPPPAAGSRGRCSGRRRRRRRRARRRGRASRRGVGAPLHYAAVQGAFV